MTGNHQSEENTGILVVNERKLLSKLKRTDIEGIKLPYFFVTI